MKNTIATSLIGLLLVITTSAANLTRYVDPFIGSAGHGHVFVGANVPFGFVNVGPSQFGKGWDWCSGYHYSDSIISGFSQLHLSGTGCGDLGDISLMPIIGTAMLSQYEGEVTGTGYYSPFSHRKEHAEVGYYRVFLERYGIEAEMTATSRVAFHRYTYPKGEKKRLIIDLEHGLGWNKTTSCLFKRIDDYTISGYRYSRGWAANRKLYFVLRFSEPVSEWYTADGDARVKGRNPYGVAGFTRSSSAKEEVLLVKVGLSAVSDLQALKNVESELPGWDFEETRIKAREQWEKELSKIDARFSSDKEARIFYSALYHTMIAPSVYCDVDGKYRGSDDRIHEGNGLPNYTTFSLWDTYRGAHPLATLIHPEMQAAWIESLLRIHKEQGFLPIWHLMSNETGCMVGSPCIPVLADLFLKGFVRDSVTVYEAMKQSMLLDMRGLKYLKSLGYIPCDKEQESVAKNLENYVADWCVAQVALKMGYEDDANYFLRRSTGYKQIFDTHSGFFRALQSDGVFKKELSFNPCYQTSDYTEGTPWQYLWMVPQDVNGLIALLGGKERFEQRLDSLFMVSSELGEVHNPDITGMIGQYAHGNEPSHHVCYLYNYIGKPWKGGVRIREVMKTLYDDTPDGLCGNEDVGQMSAWYVLSALGFYPVEPCGGRYMIGTPTVEKADVKVGDGKVFQIRVHNAAAPYVQSVRLNGKELTTSFLLHADLIKGGTLEFRMGNKPSAFGTSPSACPS